MTTKTTSYPLRNWPKYNEALKNRGSITFWFSEDEKNGWKSQKKADGKGRPEMYSDTAIQCLLVTREVYHLTALLNKSLAKLFPFISSLNSTYNLIAVRHFKPCHFV